MALDILHSSAIKQKERDLSMMEKFKNVLNAKKLYIRKLQMVIDGKSGELVVKDEFLNSEDEEINEIGFLTNLMPPRGTVWQSDKSDDTDIEEHISKERKQ